MPATRSGLSTQLPQPRQQDSRKQHKQLKEPVTPVESQTWIGISFDNEAILEHYKEQGVYGGAEGGSGHDAVAFIGRKDLFDSGRRGPDTRSDLPLEYVLKTETREACRIVVDFFEVAMTASDKSSFFTSFRDAKYCEKMGLTRDGCRNILGWAPQWSGLRKGLVKTLDIRFRVPDRRLAVEVPEGSIIACVLRCTFGTTFSVEDLSVRVDVTAIRDPQDKDCVVPPFDVSQKWNPPRVSTYASGESDTESEDPNTVVVAKNTAGTVSGISNTEAGTAVIEKARQAPEELERIHDGVVDASNEDDG